MRDNRECTDRQFEISEADISGADISEAEGISYENGSY